MVTPYPIPPKTKSTSGSRLTVSNFYGLRPISSNRILGKVTAFEALKKGLDDLMNLCDVVSEKFTAAKEAYGKDAEEDE